MTIDQFNNTESIPSEGYRNIFSLLFGKGAYKNNTLKRFLKFRKIVNKNLEGIKPNILLLSSNSSKEYIVDIIEAIALPKGFVHHFRYQLKWLSMEIRDELNFRDKKFSPNLKGLVIVIAYCKQQKNNDSQYTWLKIVPVRLGKLIYAFKTGNSDGDFAHFYFELSEYITPIDGFMEKLQEKMGDGFNKHYSSIFVDGLYEFINIQPDIEQFHLTCNQLENEDFISDTLIEAEGYNPPIYGLIKNLKYKRKNFFGLLGQNNIELKARFNKFTMQSYFKIKENKEYLVEFITYKRKTAQSIESLIVELNSDENYFLTPPNYDFIINSNYDQESWPIVSKILDRPVITRLKFFLGNKISSTNKDLNISIALNLHIGKKYFFRTTI